MTAPCTSLDVALLSQTADTLARGSVMRETAWAGLRRCHTQPSDVRAIASTDERPVMRLPPVLALIGVCLSITPLHASAEVLTGAARRDYEQATREGALSTACSSSSPDFVFWAGKTPSTLEVAGEVKPVQFERHKVGDFISRPYQCRTSAGVLTLTTTLTHTTSNSECGAGNVFIAKLKVLHVGSYSDHFLVDGCGGTSGLLIRGKLVRLCRMTDDDKNGLGHCAEATDAVGTRQLR